MTLSSIHGYCIVEVAQKMLEIFRGAVALIDEIDWVLWQALKQVTDQL